MENQNWRPREEEDTNCCSVRKRDRRITPLEFFKSEMRDLVAILNSSSSSQAQVKDALLQLSNVAGGERFAKLIVECGAVSPLVRYLQAPLSADPQLEVQKESAFTLGLLALQPEHQQRIVDAGAIPLLVDLLKRQVDAARNSPAVNNGVIIKAANAITNLAYENSFTKTHVRVEGGIPPLVELLNFTDKMVLKTSALSLKTLSFNNDENITQIVECNALPALILMLQYEVDAISHQAVGVIASLVRSSPDIKKEVLLAGALQPVIRLLSSRCSGTQEEAALVLGRLATDDTDCQVHIVQRGAVGQLVEFLQSPHAKLREVSAFSVASLAQDTHNQAGIVQCGAIPPLSKLLDSENGSLQLQHNVLLALYALADNEDNVAGFIRDGVVQRLHDGEFIVQPARDRVTKTLKRLEEKIHGRVLRHLLYLMRIADRCVQIRVTLVLAHLCSPCDQKTIFIDNNGILLELLESSDLKHKRDSCLALYKLAEKASSLSPVDAPLPSPRSQVYLGEQYVNNPTQSDVTFLVEGKRFYAHKVCLAASDAYRAMFDGRYKEKDAKDIIIPNIRWDVFQLMMR